MSPSWQTVAARAGDAASAGAREQISRPVGDQKKRRTLHWLIRNRSYRRFSSRHTTLFSNFEFDSDILYWKLISSIPWKTKIKLVSRLPLPHLPPTCWLCYSPVRLCRPQRRSLLDYSYTPPQSLSLSSPECVCLSLCLGRSSVRKKVGKGVQFGELCDSGLRQKAQCCRRRRRDRFEISKSIVSLFGRQWMLVVLYYTTTK